MSFIFDSDRRAWARGKPYQCDFQAGMFWCQSRTLYEVHRPAMGGDGWECAECGTFYIDNEQHLKNLLFKKENYGDQEET